uniref:Uncharacterized protein n=1 Tax=Ursus americanus TaxID=9643 RepID=A0A452SSY1_URSAM
MIPGGLTEARPATPEIQEIANKVSCYIHLKVFKGLPQQNPTLTLTGYQTDKSKDDEITGF